MNTRAQGRLIAGVMGVVVAYGCLFGEGAAGGSNAVEQALRDLDSPELSARRDAVETLGRIGGDTVVERLLVALRHGSAVRRSGAAGALGMIGDRRAVAPLAAMLHSNCPFAADAGEALARIADPSALKALVAAARVGNPDTRALGVASLGKRGGEKALGHVLQAFNDPEPCVTAR